MPDLEHEIAVYYDENNARHEAKASSLLDPQILADLKQRDLYDETEQKRLQARWAPNMRPHFYEISKSTGTRVLFTGEVDATHNARVAELLKQLADCEPLEFVLLHPGRGDIAERAERLASLPEYKWGGEVHRILSKDAIVRHDIFGQTPELRMSIIRPWIAIEVINTHYPEETAFSAMLAASRDFPFVVLFDFTAHPNTFVKVDKFAKRLRIRPWTFYIKEGALWQGGSATSINSSAQFKIELVRMITAWTAKRTRQDA